MIHDVKRDRQQMEGEINFLFKIVLMLACHNSLILQTRERDSNLHRYFNVFILQFQRNWLISVEIF